MNTFHCTACQALVFFENTHCLNCNRVLAFAADRMAMLAVEPMDQDLWTPVEQGGVNGNRYRLCINYSAHGVCNWAVGADTSTVFCPACALTQTIPNLDTPENHVAWARLETAKRRLIYSILTLDLPLRSKSEDSQRGLEFQFLGSSVALNGDRGRVLTGHDNGLITINVAEADDVYREAQRQQQHEPYRTLLGHFRHEIGHYYWDQLIAKSSGLEPFRRLFGDERLDYGAAVNRHYAQGAPANWGEKFISAYATTHPWEDWAESWAHVMHMVDALETAQAIGLSVNPLRSDEPVLSIPREPPLSRVADFDQLVREWSSLTYMLNNLTRGLGLPDAYPFIVSGAVIEKLRFVCDTMIGQRTG